MSTSEWATLVITILGMLLAAATTVAVWLYKRGGQENAAETATKAQGERLDQVIAEMRERDAAREKEIDGLREALQCLGETVQAQQVSIAQLTERCGQALQASENNRQSIHDLRNILQGQAHRRPEH